MAPELLFDKASENKTRIEQLESAFNNSRAFPDLTVTCGTQSWFCHKHVLCQQSEWFQRACSGRFKEGGASTIELQEQDSEAVGAMLRYCYDVKSVVDLKAEPGRLVFVTMLFALGEKYFVRGLPTLCADIFARLATQSSSAELAEAIVIAYTETSDIDRHLKDRVVVVMLDKPELLKGGNEDFDKVLASVGDFGADMTKSLMQDRLEQQQQKHKQDAKLVLVRRYRCPFSRCTGFHAAIADIIQYTHHCPGYTGYTANGLQWRLGYELA